MSSEDIIAEIPKHGKKQFAKQLGILIIPPILPLLILIVMMPVDVKPFVNEFIPNYKILMNFMPTVIQVLMGGVVVISIFYLGKVHDYRKELIIHHTKFMLLIRNENDPDKKEKLRTYHDVFKDLIKIHRDSKKIIIFSIVAMLVVFSALLIFTISKTEPNEDYFVVLSVILIALLIQFLSFWYFFEYMMEFSEVILNLILKSQYVLGSYSS